MRTSIPVLLAHIAALVVGAEGCSRRLPCEGNGNPPTKTIEVTGDQACTLAHAGVVTWYLQVGSPGPCAGIDFDPTGTYALCTNACGSGYDGCTLPEDYIRAYAAPLAPTDASLCDDAALGPSDDGGSPGSGGCPSVSGSVSITCNSAPCLGRRTAGVDEPRAPDERSIGEYFATCAYFEAVSVHAFERLAAELAAHGAPARLVRAARRARRDEIRHARATRDIARRFGVEPSSPAPRDLPVRSLFDVARENAVEGCVRETFGALLAMHQRARAADLGVRNAMQAIALDETHHAELAWAIHRWALPRLSASARRRVRRAQEAALDELRASAGRWHPDVVQAAGMPSPAVEARLVGQFEAAVLPRRGPTRCVMTH
jgi:hypothetical protein